MGPRAWFRGAAASAVRIDDLVDGTVGNDSLVGTAGNDTIYGYEGQDTLQGGAGDDWLWGGSGVDQIDGGADVDTVFFLDGTQGVVANLLTGVTTNDGFGNAESIVNVENAHGTNFADRITLGTGNSSGFGWGGNDTFIGGAGDNKFWAGSGADSIDGGSGFDEMAFSPDGIDTPGWSDFDTAGTPTHGLVVDLAAGTIVDGWGATDRVTSIEWITGSDFADSMSGDGVANRLIGDPGNDALVGLGGNDTLVGGNGSDSLAGGNGDDGLVGDDLGAGVIDGSDTLSGGAGQDTLLGGGLTDFLDGGAGDDSLDGGSGSDWADYRSATGAVSVSLALAGPQNTVSAGTDTLTSIEGLIGSGFADTLNGASGNGVFELFSGGAGNDTINGGIVADTVNYSDGNQVEYGLGATGGVNVNLKTGQASDGQGGTDTLVNIDFVIGTDFADTITGSDGTLFEVFTGLGGADRFDGGDLSQGSARINYGASPAAVNVDFIAGTAQDGYGTVDSFVNINFVRGSSYHDTLRGSDATAYNESFEGRTGNDLIDGRGGIDQVRYDNAPSAVNVSLVTGLSSGGDGIDTLLSIENLRGSAFNDTLTGNDGDNVLDGRTGNDSLVGGAGDDTFTGGAGNDSLVGGGQLTFDYVSYAGAGSAVTVNLATGTASSSSEGSDLLSGIEGVFGSAFAESLTGDANGNYLRGNGGNDTLDGAGGTDIADYSTASAAVSVDLQAGTGTAPDGTDVLIAIENLFGSAFDDVLRGDAGSNSLRGRVGNDTLDGRGGLDRADYRSAAGAVTVNLTTNTSSGADGTDTLISIEDVRGSEFYADRLTGSSAGNILDGMGGNDTLTGGAGNDTLVGGDGNDVYVVDGGETISETGTVASTADHVMSSVAWTLGANLERLTLTGSSGFRGTGNTLANLMTGNVAANALDGGAGNDTLNGAAGNDTLNGGTGNDARVGGDGNDVYIVDVATDRISELGTVGSTADRVQSRVTWTLGANLENLTLTGNSSIGGTGNALANLLVGNAGNNVLNGGAGNDVLVGGAGNDSLTGGAGLDTFRFNAALSAVSNVDRVADFVAADDRFQLDDAVFLGIGPAGALAAGAFRLGTAAGDASDRVIYDSATGQLFFDADGTGAGAQLLFATLAAGTALSAADFVIF